MTTKVVKLDSYIFGPNFLDEFFPYTNLFEPEFVLTKDLTRLKSLV